MQKLCDFLAINDLWEVKRSNLFIRGDNTTLELRNSIKQQIKDVLSGNDITKQELKYIKRHFEYLNVLSGGQYKNTVDFLDYFTFLGIDIPRYNHEKEKWLKVKKLIEEMAEYETSKPKYSPDNTVIIKCNSIQKLRGYGYQIPLKHGRFYPSESDEKKFAQAMLYRFSKIGGEAITLILESVTKIYDYGVERYRFYPILRSNETPDLSIPWGYLLNVALTFYKKQCSVKDARKTFEEIKELSKHYFSVLELQPLTVWSNVFRPITESVDEVMEHIMYDQHLAQPQISDTIMLEILEGLVKNSGLNGLDQLFVETLRFICQKNIGLKSLCIEKEMLIQHFNKSFSVSDINKVLSFLSTPYRELNNGYYIPSEVGKKTFYKYPFIEDGNHLVYLNRHFCAKGFYHSWMKYNKYPNIGGAFENYFSDVLLQHNISFIKNFEYRIPKELQNDLGFNSESGECDFIIECEKTIFIIETKRKEITSDAMSGNAKVALIDLANSLLHGLIQASKFEFCLRKLGKLKSQDGSYVIELKQKRIEKIHLSLFDFYSVHDEIFVKHFLLSVFASDFSSDSPCELDVFRKKQKQFRSIYMTDIMKDLYFRCGDRSEVNMNSFNTCHSFSMPQILHFLKIVNSNSDFCREISRTFDCSFSTNDRFFEHYHSSQLDAYR